MDKRDLYRRVAELHVANLDQGFLATLGVEFLALMYRAIDEGEDSVLLVAEQDGRIVGFVSGAMGMRAVYRRMLRRWPRLAWTLLPSAFRPKRVWRILEILRYGGGSEDPRLPRAELLSIAVDAHHRGRQHAELLYRRLSEHFRDRGIPAFRIVVGAALAPAHKFYGRMGARVVAQVEVHRGASSTVYVQELPQA